MINKIALAGALLISTAVYAQTPAPPTAQSAAPPPATGPGQSAVPDKMAPAAAPDAGAAGHTSTLSAADTKFVHTIASAGMAEVQEGQLAQQKSDSTKVKDFAQRMVTDHTANNQQLTTLAQQKGVTLSDTLAAKDQRQLDRLKKLSVDKFDRAYMKDQVRDHEQVLALLQKEAQDGQDADVKAFAQQTIPVIQQHLDMAKSGGTTY